ALQPDTLHGKLVTTIGISPWDNALLQDEETWRAKVREIADQLYTQPDLFEQEIDWLCSSEARSASILGEEIGKLDQEGKFSKSIIEASVQHQYVGLAKGYIWASLNTFPSHDDQINHLLDDIEQSNPIIAY